MKRVIRELKVDENGKIKRDSSDFDENALYNFLGQKRKVNSTSSAPDKLTNEVISILDTRCPIRPFYFEGKQYRPQAYEVTDGCSWIPVYSPKRATRYHWSVADIPESDMQSTGTNDLLDSHKLRVGSLSHQLYVYVQKMCKYAYISQAPVTLLPSGYKILVFDL